MTLHEQITKDVLELFDEGKLTRDILEYFQKELLHGDEIYNSIYLDYQELKKTCSEQEAVIQYLERQLKKENKNGKGRT